MTDTTLLKAALEKLEEMDAFISSEHDGKTLDRCPSCAGGARVEGQLCVKCRLKRELEKQR
jgi:hypothetical protein